MADLNAALDGEHALAVAGAAFLHTRTIGFTLLYGTLAVIEVRLMIESIRKGPEPLEAATAAPAANGYAPIAAE